MITITQKEAKKMRELGYGYAVKKTWSGHKKYFLVEEKDVYEFNPKTKKDELVRLGALSVLSNYQKNISIKNNERRC